MKSKASRRSLRLLRGGQAIKLAAVFALAATAAAHGKKRFHTPEEITTAVMAARDEASRTSLAESLRAADSTIDATKFGLNARPTRCYMTPSV